MIGSPGEPGVASLRAPVPSEEDALQALWEASYAVDDPAGFVRGGWALAAWATDSRVLLLGQQPVGAVAVRAETAPDGAMPARVALDPATRRGPLATLLVRAALDLVAHADGTRARLFVPAVAEWAVNAAEAVGFEPVRTIAHMLLPASTPTPTTPLPSQVRLRPARADEDEEVLAALNRAWEGTWNFVSITPEMLAEDLNGQREGMLLAVDGFDRIVATCHAVYDPSTTDPEGNPRSWISNLTVDPAFRGRGLARAMLAAGIAHLRARGAKSITLGVDAGDPAPFSLYQSVGFQIASRMQAWDRQTYP